ncbi:hypothetical protein IRZ81_11780 [Pseudomonas putida]|uniref:hypothetical protein n=1 Tax=Pseudomonas putida TaxID=303 RepID=UPI0018AB278D|nr:hypothetical protein [Pseudomonas putida]MBF8651476.1 hypothetical protein [Pseudomonas putida]MBF8655544.1 hypothetical protein [Pseudomonas putida]
MDILNIVGLCLNMIGVVLIFFWALPQSFADAGTGRGLEDGTVINGKTVGQLREEAERQKTRAKIIAWAALSLMFAGFLCQLLAAAWPHLHAWIAASICRA